MRETEILIIKAIKIVKIMDERFLNSFLWFIFNDFKTMTTSVYVIFTLFLVI